MQICEPQGDSIHVGGKSYRVQKSGALSAAATATGTIAAAKLGKYHRIVASTNYVDATGPGTITYGWRLHEVRRVQLNSLPADNTRITVDGITAGAKTFDFKVGGGVDADPAYFINTTIFNTPYLAVMELARKINVLQATLLVEAALDYNAPNEPAIWVMDQAAGASAALVAKSGGDSATSVTLSTIATGAAAQDAASYGFFGSTTISATYIWPFSAHGWLDTPLHAELTYVRSTALVIASAEFATIGLPN